MIDGALLTLAQEAAASDTSQRLRTLLTNCEALGRVVNGRHEVALDALGTDPDATIDAAHAELDDLTPVEQAVLTGRIDTAVATAIEQAVVGLASVVTMLGGDDDDVTALDPELVSLAAGWLLMTRSTRPAIPPRNVAQAAGGRTEHE